MLRLSAVLVLATVACGPACRDDPFGGENQSRRALARTGPCEKWAALAGDVGCALPNECAIEARCADLARAFIDCTATDISQCLCETGGDQLNCEGAYKPSEGPARCAAEHRRLEDCQAERRPIP